MKHNEARLTKLATSELLSLYAKILDELRQRHIVRSTNNPVADLAELLVVQALGLKLAPKSTRGYDAADSRGRRYQIKGRRITPHNSSRQLSFIRGLKEPQEPFDYLAGVLFNENFSVMRGCIIPVALIRKVAKHRSRENAWRLLLLDKLWEQRGVRDITARLKATQSKVFRVS